MAGDVLDLDAEVAGSVVAEGEMGAEICLIMCEVQALVLVLVEAGWKDGVPRCQSRQHKRLRE